MPKFGAASLAQLMTCHNDLQVIANEAIKYIDFSITEGHRGKAAQELAFAKGNTQLHYPFGNHNKLPSMAFDFAPFPTDWGDGAANTERWVFIAGYIMCIAEILLAQGKITHRARWGGDWNRNDDMRDEHFRDRPHIELVPV